MDPGPSEEGEPPPPPRGPDILKQSYEMTVHDLVKLHELAVLLRSAFPGLIDVLPLRATQKIKRQTQADIFATKIEAATPFSGLFETFNPDEDAFFRKALRQYLDQLVDAPPDDVSGNQSILDTTISADPTGARRKTRKYKRKSKKTRKHRRKQIRK